MGVRGTNLVALVIGTLPQCDSSLIGSAVSRKINNIPPGGRFIDDESVESAIYGQSGGEKKPNLRPPLQGQLKRNVGVEGG